MATTVRSSSQATSATGTAAAITAPSGTTTGDLVLVIAHANGQTTWADNNGGTPFTKAAISGDDSAGNYQPNTSGGQTASVFWRRIVGGDPGTYNFTMGATGRWSLAAITLQNPNASTVFDAGPTGGNNLDSNATTGTSISVTTATAGALHFAVLCIDLAIDPTIGSPPATYAFEQSVIPNQPLYVAYKVITSPGATGAQTFTWGNTTNWMALSFAITDVGAGGGPVKAGLGVIGP